MAHDTFKAGVLTAVIGDHGLPSLVHRTAPRSLSAPPRVGLTVQESVRRDRYAFSQRENDLESALTGPLARLIRAAG